MIVVGQSEITIDQFISMVDKRAAWSVDSNPNYKGYIEAGHRFVNESIAHEQQIYGMTTGFGQSVGTMIPAKHQQEHASNLITYHGCGLGAMFDAQSTRAIMLARLISLAKGRSGVSYILLERIYALLEQDILPLVPQEGSVGASGDLTPLSYVAAAIQGQRQVRYLGSVINACEALERSKQASYILKPRESLAVMNGTSVMTALACLAYARLSYLVDLVERISAMACFALQGNIEQFAPTLFAVKPHPGQTHSADAIYSYLSHLFPAYSAKQVQDPYSIRCAPHIIGCLRDAMSFSESVIEIELNSTNDNPVVDLENKAILHGGHFYGGHMAMVMDTLKTQAANISDMLDRQFALLVDSRFSRGLPGNLSQQGEDTNYCHGFKALQITVSACTAEALKLTMPASVFSRSTECHNQDKVSMGTIAARDCIRIIELVEQCAASLYLACCHAVQIRCQNLNIPTPEKVAQFNKAHPPLKVDRELEYEVRAIVESIRQKTLL